MNPLDSLGTEGALSLFILQPLIRVADKGQENLSDTSFVDQPLLLKLVSILVKSHLKCKYPCLK